MDRSADQCSGLRSLSSSSTGQSTDQNPFHERGTESQYLLIRHEALQTHLNERRCSRGKSQLCTCPSTLHLLALGREMKTEFRVNILKILPFPLPFFPLGSHQHLA